MTTVFASAQTGTSSPRAVLRSVHLRGPAGRLEALLNEGAPDAACAALICHPHPSGGGTMHNKVVFRAMKAMNDPAWGLGWPVLRFNFRGTGLSQGAHDGQAEAEDVLAALAWLEKEYNLPLVLAGFSFGAAMALSACATTDLSACAAASPLARKVRALALLGLPIQAEDRAYRYPTLKDCPLPKLFLSGANDPYAPAEELAAVAAAAEPKQLVLLPRADHFFTGQLEPMQSALAAWLKGRIQEQLP